MTEFAGDSKVYTIKVFKRVRIYLQVMQYLPIEHPLAVPILCGTRVHTVRQSKRFWAGLCTDLAIEQAMMRVVKGHGGLTREREDTEPVRMQ